MLLSTDRGKSDDGGALAGTKPARGAGDSRVRVGRTDDNRTPFSGAQVLVDCRRENCGDWGYAEIDELLRMVDRIGTQVDREAVFVRVPDSLAVREIGERVVVREREAAPTFIRIDQGAQCSAVDRAFIVADEVAGGVVSPERTGWEPAHDIEKLVEAVDAHAVHDVIAGASAIEKRPEKAADRTVLGVAEAVGCSAGAFAEWACRWARYARARRHHDGAGVGILGFASDEEFVHMR